ncbi:MAG TPA: hypothetical protein VEK32_13280 [Thermodesulfobacteriota bacterium]|nr:hypothetical protein [Thermodesulfobacteriota bacterium]
MSPPYPEAVWRPGHWRIGEESGFGLQVVGRDLQGLMRSGYPAIGSRGEKDGSGRKATGSTDSQE